MHLLDQFNETWSYFKQNKSYVYKSILIITWSLSFIITFSALATGVYLANKQDIERLTLPMLWIWGGKISISNDYYYTGEQIFLPTTLIKSVAQQLSNYIEAVIIQQGSAGAIQASYNGNKFNNVIGYSANYIKPLKFNIAEGRAITPLDISEHKHIAVIDNASKNLLTYLFGNKNSPIGKTLLLNGIPFKIIGYIDNDHVLNGAAIQIPYTTLSDFKGSQNLLTPTYLFIIKGISVTNFEKKIKTIIKKRMKLDSNDTTAISSQDIVEQGKKYKISLRVFLTSLVLIGISILFLSLVSLVQCLALTLDKRLGELALKCALGFTKQMIAKSIYLEIIIFYLISSGISILLAYSMVNLIERLELSSFFGIPTLNSKLIIALLFICIIITISMISLTIKRYTEMESINVLEKKL